MTAQDLDRCYREAQTHLAQAMAALQAAGRMDLATSLVVPANAVLLARRDVAATGARG